MVAFFHVVFTIFVVVESGFVEFDVDTKQNETIQSSLNVKRTNFNESNNGNLSMLQIWDIEQFFTSSMAIKISNRIYDQFMDISQREHLFDFTFGRGNDKIRGNDYIDQKHIMCLKQSLFYCKYEYKRDCPLHRSLLSYLNSTLISNIMSKILNVSIIAISDLFVSVFDKNNYLNTHNDKGLGQFAFILFLSQNWDFNVNGGRLIFDCQQSDIRTTSCLEVEFNFNEMIIFQVTPNIVPHHVEKVKVSKPRIAITGWFYTDSIPICTKCISQQRGQY